MTERAVIDPVREIADTSEETEVRRRFASHNARYLGVIFGIAAFVSVILTIVYAVNRVAVPSKLAGAVAMTLVTVTTTVLCFRHISRERSRMPETILTRHFTEALLLLYAAAFVVLLVLSYRNTQTALVLGPLYVCILVILQMPFARRLAIQLLLLSSVVIFLEVIAARGMHFGYYVGLTAMHGFVLLAGGFSSRRVAAQTTSDWSVRRDHAREQLRMRGELQYAREVQLSMLPDAAPELDWIEIAATSLPATEVGGDYFDYFPHSEGRLAIVCGDVAGHGLASGIVLSAVRAGLMLLRSELTQPGMVLRRLHEVVQQASRRRMLTTACIALFNRDTSAVTVANAGHPPLLVRRSEGTVVSLDLFSPPLGVRLPVHVPERKVPFTEGDVFVLHSDGVYESRNAAGDTYGLDALEASLAATPLEATAAEIRDAILREVEAFRGAVAQEDDVTVVVARIRGT